MTVIELDGEYECGHKYCRIVEVRDPAPAEKLDGVDGWWETVAWYEIGDGHTEDEGHCTTAKVIACDDPRLVGAEYEWVG